MISFAGGASDLALYAPIRGARWKHKSHGEES